jgi:hypothetical protein
MSRSDRFVGSIEGVRISGKPDSAELAAFFWVTFRKYKTITDISVGETTI